MVLVVTCDVKLAGLLERKQLTGIDRMNRMNRMRQSVPPKVSGGLSSWQYPPATAGGTDLCFAFGFGLVAQGWGRAATRGEPDFDQVCGWADYEEGVVGCMYDLQQAQNHLDKCDGDCHPA